MNEVVDLDHLQLIIKDRSGEVFQGQVLSVTCCNQVGAFDVMPRHSNMVTTIYEKIVVQTKPEHFETFNLNSGLLRVTNNKVEIYVGL
ncbi:MAG TPA: hypothetical protein VD999_03460 [Vitreimonas sp.]|nr:hypothetical protein [Vitreimonas sp.]